MSQQRILIVEDEFIIAQNLRQILTDVGYVVSGHAFDAQGALEILAKGQTDLVLLDIRIAGKMDGIALAAEVRRDFGLPFMFLTSFSDKSTIERAKQTHPMGFLIKPFKKAEIFAMIEIAVANHSPRTQQDHILIKVGNSLKKVMIQEIVLLKADRVYVEVHRKGMVPLIVRESLSVWEGKLSADFVRIHRSYIVHLKHIESLETNSIIVDGKEIPITRQVRDELVARLQGS